MGMLPKTWLKLAHLTKVCYLNLALEDTFEAFQLKKKKKKKTNIKINIRKTARGEKRMTINNKNY
jgi:hypothetical protein